MKDKFKTKLKKTNTFPENTNALTGSDATFFWGVDWDLRCLSVGDGVRGDGKTVFEV